VVVLDLERWEMHIVNAGHMPPILRPDGGAPEELGDGIVGLPLAVIDRPYEELVLPMKPGTTLMLYTDGVSEMRNPTNEMFGKDRLMNLIATSRDDAEALGKSVLEGVTKFASDRPQNDDLTIVCFRYKSQAG
jgi:serine phosphatase RsbU (regulator of sigma subunit)